MTKFSEQFASLLKSGHEFAICTIVNTKGSSPGKVGTKMIVLPNGKIADTIGGGELEKRVIMDAMQIMSEKTPRLFRYDLLHQLNMCCGGTVEVFIEPFMKKKKLYIFGAGHLGNALAKYACDIDFEIFLVDERKELLDEMKIVSVNKMNLSHNAALSVLPFDHETYICIMTYSHPIDREILAFCLKKPFAYLGMIGSRRKAEMTKKMFLEAGIGNETQLARVDMPMGVSIHAEGPNEIAISILAKLIETKNQKNKKEIHVPVQAKLV